MKKMFLKILLMMIPIICTGQVVISTSQLNGSRWKIKGDNSGNIYEYTSTLEKCIKKNGSSFMYYYYLSNSIVNSFDKSKLRTSSKGCYLVTYNEKANITYCWLIQKFSKSDRIMILKMMNDDIIGTSNTCVMELTK